MQILGLLGMYFDAVVVEVEKYLLFSDWLWPYCELNCPKKLGNNSCPPAPSGFTALEVKTP